MNDTPTLIAFGSNIAPERHLAQGIARLQALAGVEALSTVYRTKALPGPDTPPETRLPDFLNGALHITGSWNPWELRALLKQIEREMGRQPHQPGWAPRPLDLDIALMGSMTFHTPPLAIPDPDIADRAFLAIPLAELAPDLYHPTLRQKLTAIAARFTPRPADMIPDSAITARLRAIIPL
ncbi:MAG: 2-amino-4-hydroxy-6-hydroxymethyldihydropteridine diphosphokinase [Magnetococcales bacterium]|nr:2-amino-4-hydroxy-6-hydroxymethyldihydropteridine diphosphokinase [Magnetococcales bacterium]